MTCPRCAGRMVLERFFDVLETGVHTDAWRCVCCGEMMDETILRNRIIASDSLTTYAMGELRHAFLI